MISTRPTQRRKEKSLLEAYLLWFPFGLFGFHHFYLGNIGLGILYFFSLGLFGLGWILDGFLMSYHVRNANRIEQVNDITPRQQKQLYVAYLLSIWPVTGLLGIHHYYLRRPCFGVIYTLTLGLLGVGYLVDWIRTPFLVKRANKQLAGEIQAGLKYLDDAYLLLFPFGFLGLHHFYLRRPCWGIFYFFTFGCLGIGWLVDFFRLPYLVRQCNGDYLADQLYVTINSNSEDSNHPHPGYGTSGAGNSADTKRSGTSAAGYGTSGAEYGANTKGNGTSAAGYGNTSAAGYGASAADYGTSAAGYNTNANVTAGSSFVSVTLPPISGATLPQDQPPAYRPYPDLSVTVVPNAPPIYYK